MAEFDVRFEREILAKAAVDPVYRRRAARILQDHRFSDEHYTWMWRAMRNLSASDHFTVKLAAMYARKDFPKDEARKSALEAVRDILIETEPEHPAASLEELDDFIRYHRLIGAIKDASGKLSKADIRNAEEILSKALKSRGDTEYDYADFYENFDERQRERKASAEGAGNLIKIPSIFLPTMDKYLEGGIEPGEVGLIIGTTGRGKSILAANIAYAASMNYETLYISTEMKRMLVDTRLDARMLHEDYANIKFGRLTEVELEQVAAQYKRVKGAVKGHLRVISTSVRKCTTESFERMIEDYQEDGHDPKLVVFDSADHMKPSEKTNDRRSRESAAYWDVKSVMEEKGIACWSTTHAPKDVVNKIASAENVGESYDKARISDLAISINQTKTQKKENRAKIFGAKNRQGNSQWMIEVELDLARMHIKEVPPDDVVPEEDD